MLPYLNVTNFYDWFVGWRKKPCINHVFNVKEPFRILRNRSQSRHFNLSYWKNTGVAKNINDDHVYLNVPVGYDSEPACITPGL